MQSYMKDEPLARESETRNFAPTFLIARASSARAAFGIKSALFDFINATQKAPAVQCVCVSGVKVDQPDIYFQLLWHQAAFRSPDDEGDGGSCGLSSSLSALALREETSSRLIFQQLPVQICECVHHQLRFTTTSGSFVIKRGAGAGY